MTEGLADSRAALSTGRILGVLGHAWHLARISRNDHGEKRVVREPDGHARATSPPTTTVTVMQMLRIGTLLAPGILLSS